MDEKRDRWRFGLAVVLATTLIGAFTVGAGWPWSELIVLIGLTFGVGVAILAGLALLKHLRFRFSLALVLLVVVLISELLAVWALTPPRPATISNWTKVKVGMTEAEVEKLMGSRGGAKPAGGGETDWFYPDHITIGFRNGRVAEVFRYDPLD